MIYTLNENGMREIKNWIAESSEKNSRVDNLSVDGIASEIEQDINLEDDLENNSEFNWETGYRDAQGRMMFISFDIDCFNKNQTKLKINNNQTATVTIPNDQVEIFMEMLALGETEWLASDRVENYLPWRGWTWESSNG